MAKKVRKDKPVVGENARQKKKAKPLDVSILSPGSTDNIVATSADIRLATGDTPRNDDVEVMMMRTADATLGGKTSSQDRPPAVGASSGCGGRGDERGGDQEPSPRPSTGPAVGTGANVRRNSETTTSGQAEQPPAAPGNPSSRQSTAQLLLNGQPVTIVMPRENKPKQLKIIKFKGVDDTTPVTTWLRSIQNEIERQNTTLGVSWLQHQLYLEVAANFEGEALRWFGTIAGSIREEDQTLDHLSRLLRAKYTVQRSTPEVVARLNGRRQMIGERLVEYAQVLREIVADRGIGEEWLIDAFLCGMHNEQSAAAVRGHYPQTLDEAVRIAVFQVGEYGEGYRVGLEVAISRQRARSTATGAAQQPAAASATAATVAAPLGQAQVPEDLASRLASVVTGYEGLLGAPVQTARRRPPRYDTEGRLITAGIGDEKVPNWLEAASLLFAGLHQGARAGGNAANQVQSRNRAAGRDQRPPPARTQPQLGHQGKGGLNERRFGKTRKMEARGIGQAQTNGGLGIYGPRQPLLTKEDRLRNYRRYQDSLQNKSVNTYSGDSRECYYCHQTGHLSYDCELKKQDMQGSDGGNQQSDGNGRDAENSGNVERA